MPQSFPKYRDRGSKHSEYGASFGREIHGLAKKFILECNVRLILSPINSKWHLTSKIEFEIEAEGA